MGGTAGARTRRIMRRMGELIERDVPALASLETDDTGLPIHQTANQLIPRAAENFHFFSEVATRMDGRCYPVDKTMLNYTLIHPVGVCALISPWNVPFMTATWKVAPCLAFGNTAVLKMCELSPSRLDRLGELALEAGVPPGVLNVVHGYGRTAGKRWCGIRTCAPFRFTGGTVTGERVVARGGLKKLSMELGGKSRSSSSTTRATSARSMPPLFMIFSLNGERCTAGSRIFVQRSSTTLRRKFAERAVALNAVGDPWTSAPTLGIDDHAARTWRRSPATSSSARRRARPLAGGARRRSTARLARAGNFVRPTVFADVANPMRIAQEEIFGPVACLIPFDDEADAVCLGQRHPVRSARVVCVDRRTWAAPTASRPAIEAGMCFVNSQNVRDLRQPFGGIKESGTGPRRWRFELRDFLRDQERMRLARRRHAIPRWGGEDG